MKFILITFFISSLAHAWTLNNNFGASFKDEKVKVYVDGGTTCAGISVTADELKGMISPAVDDFWNRVPTSSLELKAAGFSDPIATINHGRLCSPTDDDCITDGQADPGGLIPAVTDIIIACNDNIDNFGASNVLAVTIPNKFSGKSIVGAVILINDASTFGTLSKSDQISVIAHEIGHAIGLGHSKETEALMYYRTVNQRKRLGQDDVDGVSYLYPIHGDAYGLCGTVTKTHPPGNPPLIQMGIAFGLMILAFELLRRSKRRPSL